MAEKRWHGTMVQIWLQNKAGCGPLQQRLARETAETIEYMCGASGQITSVDIEEHFVGEDGDA